MFKQPYLDTEVFEERFGVLYERVEKRTSRASLLHGVLIYLRKLFLCIVLVFLSSYPGIQASFAAMSSFGLLFYQLKFKPFLTKRRKYIEFFNECCVLITCYYIIYNTNSGHSY